VNTRLKELEERRLVLIDYSAMQRDLLAQHAAELKRPIGTGEGFIEVLKSHPVASALSVVLAGWAAKKLAKVSLGMWLGKQVWRFASRRSRARSADEDPAA
jgi:hypothetical protein